MAAVPSRRRVAQGGLSLVLLVAAGLFASMTLLFHGWLRVVAWLLAGLCAGSGGVLLFRSGKDRRTTPGEE